MRTATKDKRCCQNCIHGAAFVPFRYVVACCHPREYEKWLRELGVGIEFTIADRDYKCDEYKPRPVRPI